MPLKSFQVRAYKKGIVEHKSHFSPPGSLLVKEIIVKKEQYVAMGRVEIIKAVSGEEAAKTFARGHQIELSKWYNAGARPEIVIRVSNAGEREP